MFSWTVFIFMFLLEENTAWGRYLPNDKKAQFVVDRNSKPIAKEIGIQLQQRSIMNDRTDYNERPAQLQKLVQQMYQADSCVKKETGEIRHLQEVIANVDRELEEASNQVRSLSLELQEAQRLAAQRALKSHTAHLQLSAHDQLMFTARQRVDALSAQIIAAQAETGAWPVAAYFNDGFPMQREESTMDHSDQIASYPQDMMPGFGKAPLMYRNIGGQLPYYSGVPNGFQYVPVEAE